MYSGYGEKANGWTDRLPYINMDGKNGRCRSICDGLPFKLGIGSEANIDCWVCLTFSLHFAHFDKIRVGLNQL